MIATLSLVVAAISMVSLWAWRERIPYAVEMLHTVALFIEAYPGPTRVGESLLLLLYTVLNGGLRSFLIGALVCIAAFVALVPALFWQYFTALGLILAALFYESVTMYLLLAFFGFSSVWVSGGSLSIPSSLQVD